MMMKPCKTIDEILDEKTLSDEEAIEFYSKIAKEVKKKYGTTDLQKLRELSEKSEDLWLEEHVHDMEIYHSLLQKTRKGSKLK